MDLKNCRNKILLVENSASDFYKSRLPFAIFLKSNNWDVYAMIPAESEFTDLISKNGINVIEYKLLRNNKSIFQIFKLVKYFRNTIKKHEFSIVHSFRFQPNLITSLAGFNLNCKKIIHITGLGIAFSNNSLKYQYLKYISQILFIIKFLLVDNIIVQNPDDVLDIWFSKYVKSKIKIIFGSGVDTQKFNPDNYNRKLIRKNLGYNEDHQIFICVTRLIWEKGIRELIDAFKMQSNSDVVLFIVGWSDKDNPEHIPEKYISTFSNSKSIKFLGKRNDICELLVAADCFIYPSYYREGIPRSILEALAIGLPIITTDTPGCKIAVDSNKNGILIKPKSTTEIKEAVNKIRFYDLERLGHESREYAVNTFSNTIIFNQIKNLYK